MIKKLYIFRSSNGFFLKMISKELSQWFYDDLVFLIWFSIKFFNEPMFLQNLNVAYIVVIVILMFDLF